eukprot:scaffold29843_cov63-Phaeocystis_antarctica.AAC.3
MLTTVTSVLRKGIPSARNASNCSFSKRRLLLGGSSGKPKLWRAPELVIRSHPRHHPCDDAHMLQRCLSRILSATRWRVGSAPASTKLRIL